MWGGYGAKLNRTETRKSAVIGGATAMCASVGKLYPVFARACPAYGVYMAAQAGLAELDSPKSCLYLVVIPAPLVQRYHDGHCR